jgi:hypothetical protein
VDRVDGDGEVGGLICGNGSLERKRISRGSVSTVAQCYLTYCDETDDFDCERWISDGMARVD